MSFITCWLALTLNIYSEARGESQVGKQLIADTVITRTLNDKYPDDICEVILQPKQFSWTSRLKTKDLNGLIKHNKKIFKSRKFNDKERRAYYQSAKVAFLSMRSGYKPRYRYIHFYSGKDKPKWAQGKKFSKHGNHYFTY